MPSRPDNTVFYYDSSMPNAPSMSGQNGKLIELLDSCLVNGFGLKSVDSIVIAAGVATVTVSTGHSAQRFAVVEIAGVTTPAALNGKHKVVSTTTNTITLSVPDLADATAAGSATVKIAAAGWEKPFSATNRAAYRTAGGLGQYYRFLDNNTDTAYTHIAALCGFESMTDIATGTGKFPDDTKNSGRLFWPKSTAQDSTTRPWCVIATSAFVYVGINTTNHPSKSYNWLAFGDVISYKTGDQYKGFVAANPNIEENSAAANSSVFWSYYWDANLRFMARDYTGIGASSVVGIHLPGRGAGENAFAGQGPLMYPDPVTGGLRAGELTIVQSKFNPTIVRGRLPGVLAPMHGAGYIPHGTIYDNIDMLPGRATMYAAAVDANGGVLFDLTGPWG